MTTPWEILSQWTKPIQSKEAGGLSGVPVRTVGFWCERELIDAATTGTGDRRQFTPIQLVEIGMIKRMSDAGISLRRIKTVMDRARQEGTLKTLLAHDHAYYVILVDPYNDDAKESRIMTAPSVMQVFWNDGDKHSNNDKAVILETVFNDDADNTLVLNVTRIAKRIIEKRAGKQT
jgi:DNA-binding transcriptional MerR regulator